MVTYTFVSMKKLWEYSLHAIFWTGFLFLPSLFRLQGAVDFDHLMDNQHEFNILVYYVLIIVFSYINYLWLVPHYYLQKKNLEYFVIVGVCFFLVTFGPEAFDSHNHHLPPKNGGELKPPPPFLWDNRHFILLFVVSVFVAIAVQSNNQLQKIKNEKLTADLAYLKAQIHPHFLFNTLNSIYALALQKDDRTPDVIVQLADFLRFLIRDAGKSSVSLQKELSYIDNYVDLQRKRLGDTVVIFYRRSGDANNAEIAPLLLFSLIENAFKHGVNPDEESEIAIHIELNERYVRLHVANKKVELNTRDAEGGLGLYNTNERLKLLYPNKHKLIIDNDTFSFSVYLQIQLV